MTSKLQIKQRLNFLHTKLLHSYRSNKIRIFFLLMLLTSSWILTQAVHIHATYSSRLQEGIAREIIRFHVIANSDSDKDQQLKYLVKNALVQTLQPYLKDAKDINETQDIIAEMLPLIENHASQVIKEEGFNYTVTASLSPSYFPMKVYGDYTFPPGSYEALQVKIGEAQGKNWWCVMFPPLCFVDETYSIVDEDSKEHLKNLLTEEEFDSIRNNRVNVKIRFKLFYSIKKLFSK